MAATMTAPPERRALPEGDLVRGLGTGSAFAVVVGAVIGSGVFLVAADIGASVPSPVWGVAVWIAAGLISLIGGLTFAELGGRLPGTGGQYVYLREAFGPQIAFLFGWTLFLVIQAGSIAAVAAAFAAVLGDLVPLSAADRLVIASAVIGASTLVHLLGVRRGGLVLDVLSALKVLALVGLGITGLVLSSRSIHDLPATPTPGAAPFGVALIAAFWAYDGWNNVSYLAGEVRNPRRSVPLAMVGGIAIVGILYVLLNLAIHLALSPDELARSAHPAIDAATRLAGSGAGTAILCCILLSTVGCVHGLVMAGARVPYAMARDGVVPEALARLTPHTHVPSAALVLQMAWSIVLVVSGTYDQLFTYVIAAAFVFYGLCAAAVIVLRRRSPDAERAFSVPLYPWVPLAYALFCAAFVINACREKPLASLAGLGIVASGVPAYAWFTRRRRPRSS
jgi:APA family basic amino acid/polyamine antiporter